MRENPRVRSTGHRVEALPVAEMVRASSGRPRRADAGQAITLSGTASRVRARLTPAAATMTATKTLSAMTPPASRSRVTEASTAAVTAHSSVHGWARNRATRHMRPPVASMVRATARPTLRSGQVSAAQAPMAMAARTGRVCGGSGRSGQRLPSGPGPPGPFGA
jgi:hypothetical protein